MTELNLKPGDGDTLRKLLKIGSDVISIGLPVELADAMGLKASERLDRVDWKRWLPKVSKSKSILLWVQKRKDDDQDFFAALSRHLPSKCSLWTFHAMGVLMIDRLTGDAVQTLLTGSGLSDKECRNTGTGYYARRFIRTKGTKAQPVKKDEKVRKKTKSNPETSQRLEMQREKALEAIGMSDAKSNTAAFEAAVKESVKQASGNKKAFKEKLKAQEKAIAKKTLERAEAKKEAAAKKRAAKKKTLKKTVKKAAAKKKPAKKKPVKKKVAKKKAAQKKPAKKKPAKKKPAKKKASKKKAKKKSRR